MTDSNKNTASHCWSKYRSDLIFSAISGMSVYVIGIFVTYFLVILDLEFRMHLESNPIEMSTLTYVSAHFTRLEVTYSNGLENHSLIDSINFAQSGYFLPGETGVWAMIPGSTAYYLVPPVLIMIGGAVVASKIDFDRFSKGKGSLLVLGYLPAVVATIILVPITGYSESLARVTLDPITTVVIVGVLYPTLFGYLGSRCYEILKPITEFRALVNH